MTAGASPRKVFIVGMPRSGTTWVMWLLAQHPDVVALQQSGMFLPLKRLQEWWLEDHLFSGRSEGDPASNGSAYTMHGSSSVLDPEEITRRCRDVAQGVFDRVGAGAANTSAVVDQTPEHIEFVSFIRSMFPDAYFLHVVRDPRAVYSSMRAALRSWANPGGFPGGPVHVARAWETYVRLGREIEQETPNHLHLRYEELKSDPDFELQRLHRWLGLEADEAARARAIEACTLESLRAHTTAPDGFFRRGSADAWRGELSRSELRTVEYVAREEMERWGYAPIHPAAHREPLRVKFHELTRRFVRSRYGDRLLERPTRATHRLGRTLQLMRDFKLLRY